MNSRTLLVTIMMASVALAGCTDGDGGQGTDSGLNEGLGGIKGLLVDDRFRPIHLTDTPNGEFQAEGVILVKPTGQTIEETTANGEFEILGLPAGNYELVFQAEGYEAAPKAVEVETGVVAEATVEARRVVNQGGTILTQEYAIFIDCWYANPIFLHTEVNCFADLSRDSKRGGMRADYTHIDNITYMVAEFLMNEVGNYRTIVGWGDAEVVEGEYADTIVQETDYARLQLSTSSEMKSNWENGTNEEYTGWFDNSIPFIAVLFPLGEDVPVYDSQMVPQHTIEDPIGPVEVAGETVEIGDRTTPRPNDYAGAGVGTRAQVITTLFIGEPTLPDGKSIDDYCAICEE